MSNIMKSAQTVAAGVLQRTANYLGRINNPCSKRDAAIWNATENAIRAPTHIYKAEDKTTNAQTRLLTLFKMVAGETVIPRVLYIRNISHI